MGLERHEMEGLWRAIYERGGADPCHPPGGPGLAIALYGVGGIRVVRRGLAVGAALVWTRRGRRRVLVRAGLTLEQVNFLVSHELVEDELDRQGYRLEDCEEVANAGTRGVMMPTPALRAAIRVVGYDLPALAAWFCTTQVHVSLRLGEIDDKPLALVSPLECVRRGPDDALPSDADLRRIAARGSDRQWLVTSLTDVANTVLVVRSA